MPDTDQERWLFVANREGPAKRTSKRDIPIRNQDFGQPDIAFFQYTCQIIRGPSIIELALDLPKTMG